MAVNLIPNGTFEVNATGAINSGNATVARSTAQFHTGVASLLVTSVAQSGSWAAGFNLLDGNRIPLSPNTKYTFVAWVWSESGRQQRLQISERNGAGTQVAIVLGTNTTIASGTWTMFSLTFITSATTASCIPQVIGVAPAAADETFYTDDLTLELTDDTWVTIGDQRRGNIWYR